MDRHGTSLSHAADCHEGTERDPPAQPYGHVEAGECSGSRRVAEMTGRGCLVSIDRT